MLTAGCTVTIGDGPDAAGAGAGAEQAQAARPGTSTDGELTVHFLDVGQGDATLLIAPEATMLIDAGRHDADDVVPLLAQHGVDALDVVVITHGHADHIGQLDRVLEAVPVAEVWMSPTPHTTATYERSLAAIEDSEAAYEEPRAGDATPLGALDVDIVHPGEALTGDLDDDSLSLRIAFGQVSFLFTGDAGRRAEAAMLERDPEAVRATVYQVGHHGSDTSTGEDFLAAVAPEVAVWSAGRDNPYGHPHEEVVARLQVGKVRVYGTAQHGTVTVTTDGQTYEVTTSR